MAQQIYLGELEELILLMVALLNKKPTVFRLTQELENQTGRVITISAVHAVLHRLEEKGFVKSKMGGASTERGGRRKRMFTVTSYGSNAFEELRDSRNRIWGLISKA